MPPSKSPFACRTFNRTIGAREGHSFRLARQLSSVKKNKLFPASPRGSPSMLLQNDLAGHESIDELESRDSVMMKQRKRTIDDGVFDLDLDDAQIVDDYNEEYYDALDNSDLERSSCLSSDDPIEAADRDEASQWDDDEYEDDGSEFSKRIEDSVHQSKMAEEDEEKKKPRAKKKRRSSYGDRPPTYKGSTGQQQPRFIRADMLLSEDDKTTLATLRVHYAKIDEYELTIEEAATNVNYPPLKFKAEMPIKI